MPSTTGLSPRSDSQPLLLLISQVYVPDPASVGQHMADVAEMMAARGHRVVVFTSARGYEDPDERFPRRERRRGVEVVRLPLSSFGKNSLAWRLLGQGLFLMQVIVRGLFARRLGAILVSTSPPMASFAAIAIAWVRRVPITYWLMDMNPDQLVVLGKASDANVFVRAMRWLNRRIFARADDVIVLDTFMAERVRSQYRVNGRMQILPPWSPDDMHENIETADNPFVQENRLADRFVVMYSGNHSLASPLDTLVKAALELRGDPRIVFMFIGGGLGKRVVDDAIRQHQPQNMVSLPYQPLDRVRYSLSAADLHAVTLGNDMVGIIHPCKIYGAMAVGRPTLVIGPRPSHASELVDHDNIGWCVEHGDVEGTVAVIRRAAELSRESLHEIGERARQVISNRFRREQLCGSFCDALECPFLAAQSSVRTHLTRAMAACDSAMVLQDD